MGAKAMINRALNRAATPAPRVVHPQGTPTPGLARPALPVAPGHGDNAMIFRSTLLRTQGDGCELREVLDRMIMVHPEVAAKIIAAGTLGGEHLAQAVGALRVYMIHKVAQAPVMAL